MLKKTVMSLMLIFGCLFAGQAFAANVNVNLTIGQTVAWVGEQISYLPIVPFEKNGVTYVPFRFIGEALGAKINWNGKNQSVTFSSPDHIVTLYVGGKKVIIDGNEKYINAIPQLSGNYTVVPLRFISEVFGANVDYNPMGRVITIKVSQPPVAQFDIIPESVIVGQPVQFYDTSYDPDGDSLADWQWDGKKDTFDKPGTYTIRLRVKDINGTWSPWTSRTLTVTDVPNNPPQAYFAVSSSTVAQGQTINYYERSSDPDGDKIVDWQWTGKKNAFFAAGDYKVSLKVKDEKGKWSDPYVVIIHVTDQVMMNQFQYNLANPVAGEIFPMMNVKDADFTNLQPVSSDDGDAILFFSNSPESVKSSGILYADTLKGNIRLMYSHRNVSKSRKRFYLIAQNTTDHEVILKYLKGGYSGPSTDDFGVGQMGIMRYLQSYYNRDVVIPPDKWITINIGSSELVPANPGETIYGLYEVRTSDKIKFMDIALDEGVNLEDALPKLPVLARDMHNRGTFTNSTRTLTVQAEPYSRFILGDGVNDKFLMGYDGLSQQVTQDHGNYGVIYNIKINTNTPLVAIVNPRGGGFAGTFSLNGNYFFAPTWGGFAFNTLGMAAMLGTLNSSNDLLFTPPASSNLPVYIDFLPAN